MKSPKACRAQVEMLLGTLFFFALLAPSTTQANEYFTIRVVDEATGRGVPLVELRTVDNTRYWTDSQGVVAFDAPGQMNQKVFFFVQSHGYEFPADGFGFRGRALVTARGGEAELRIKRINIAERLYRVTGAGIYRDSVLLGREVPIKRPLLNAQVAGSDSVNTAVFGGKVHWFWGDTNRPAYPLGMFHVPGATSRLPAEGGLDPLRGVDLEYFTREDGFVASTCEMPGDGPTWIDGLCVIHDRQRGPRMFAKYMKVRKFLEVYERGLVEFNASAKRFEKVATFDFAAPLFPLGHAFVHAIDGREYVYFGNPHPLVRVEATAEALHDPAQYEAFTCLAPGSTPAKVLIDRNAEGRVHYAWKRNMPVPTSSVQTKLLAAGELAPEEAILALRDFDSGEPVQPHSGNVTWNAFRKRYVMIVEQSGGTSLLGEIWYAEADAPTGPWVYATKIVTHDKYSFYNVRHHPMFDSEGGRRIFFEGTYTAMFSGNDHPTPRYEYNQIMYGLDLADSRLALPVAIYDDRVDGIQRLRPNSAGNIAFMAPDRPREGLVAVGRAPGGAGGLTLTPEGEALFYAIPGDSPKPPASSAPLYEWHAASPAGSPRTVYAIEGQNAPDGFQRSAKPLCRVWRYPFTVDASWQ